MSAMSFASGQAIDLGGFNLPTGNVSIALWARDTDGTGGQRDIISKSSGNLSANQVWKLQINNMAFRAFFTAAGGQVVPTNGAITVNVWHHYALTYDGTNVRLYLDGVLSATSGATSGDVVQDATNCRIGQQGTNGNRQWIGQIRHIRVFDRTLSAREIAAAAAYRIPSIMAGVVDWWPLNYTAQGSSVVASRNIINKANGGTLIGTPTGAASPFGEYEGPRVTTYGG